MADVQADSRPHGLGRSPVLRRGEIDETYVGGKRRGHKRGRPGKDSHKVPVAGIAERGGKVAALVTKDTKKQRTLMPIVHEKVVPESMMVYTDEYRPYDAL